MPTSKSSRTPLMASLRQCVRMAADPRPDDPPSAGAVSTLNSGNWNLSRRDFVKGAMALGAAGLLPGCKSGHKGGPPRIAVVGAGIAGLNAARILVQGGLEPLVFEAGARTGGRIMTLQDVVAPGVFTEAGGEFIDSAHVDMMDLAHWLGLKILDGQGPEYAGLEEFAFHFGGKNRSRSEVIAALRDVSSAMQLDMGKLPAGISSATKGPAEALDRMPLEQYLQSRGVTGWLRDLLTAAYVSEFGLDAGEQSSLNFLTMVSLDTYAGRFRIFGDSDERYRIEGGNQRVTDGLTRALESRLRLNHRLEAVSANGEGYRLSFQGPTGPVDQDADAVIFALPFTLLRAVDFRVELPPAKRKAIDELGYGTNAKLFMGFSSRPWRKAGSTGYFFSDSGMQSGWDHSMTQPGQAGGLTIFNGGAQGMSLGRNGPVAQADGFTDSLEAVFPGSRAARNGRVGAFHWPTYPLSLGSYACYKPGQWTTLGGEEAKPVGNLFFAGEHCSRNFQGYMNGGAATGREAGAAVLARWGGKKPTGASVEKSKA
jgi:monoamine oxidase